MRKVLIYKLSLVFVIFIALISALSCGFLSSAEPTVEIIILHTNDQHGRFIGNDTDIIGIEYIAALHKNISNSILIDAGDTLHGLPIATLNKGADIIKLMNTAGYDAMTIGNHEFNYGVDRLVELYGMADFPIVTSNVLRDGMPLLDDMAIIEVAGVKIGFFGLTTESTAFSAMPDYVSGLTFENAIIVANEKTQLLRENGAHVVVAICHLGVVPVKGTLSTQVAQAVPDIDVIIDGHSHTLLENGITENGVLIAQTGEYEHNIGKIVITLKNGKITNKRASIINYEEAVSMEPDKNVIDVLNKIVVGMETLLAQEIGEARDSMSSARAPGVRTQEMQLGNLVADAYREAAEADIAIVNGGDIRADIIPGKITRGDIISILPFGNTLMVKYITPALLRDVLENGVSGIVMNEDGEIDHESSPHGRFLQISGFKFSYDPNAAVGERITSITLDDGRRLSLDDNVTLLRIVGSNYVMTGGDGYSMLVELQIQQELGAADEALAKYFENHSPVTAPEIGRITSQKENLANAA